MHQNNFEYPLKVAIEEDIFFVLEAEGGTDRKAWDRSQRLIYCTGQSREFVGNMREQIFSNISETCVKYG